MFIWYLNDTLISDGLLFWGSFQIYMGIWKPSLYIYRNSNYPSELCMQSGRWNILGILSGAGISMNPDEMKAIQTQHDSIQQLKYNFMRSRVYWPDLCLYYCHLCTIASLHSYCITFKHHFAKYGKLSENGYWKTIPTAEICLILSTIPVLVIPFHKSNWCKIILELVLVLFNCHNLSLRRSYLLWDIFAPISIHNTSLYPDHRLVLAPKLLL